MAGLEWVWPSGGERWRKPAIVGLSVGLHVLVLGLIGLRSFGLDAPASPVEHVVYIEIEPRPPLPGEVAHIRPSPERAEASPQALPDVVPPAGRKMPRRREDEDPPTPRPAAPGAPPLPVEVGMGPWRVPPEPAGDRAGGRLSASPVACASPRLLSPAEQAVCDDRLGERAAAARPITGTGNPERDGRFARQGALALARYEARRAPLSDADDPPCDRGRSPIADCEVEISVDLYSSRRGWLPNLGGEDD